MRPKPPSPIEVRQPAIAKFMTNKIQSTAPNWDDYLLEIAAIFHEFDGVEYNRDAIIRRFLTLSSRSRERLRDPADFRDEYGAYGVFLGIMYVKASDGGWKCHLTNAARNLLCGLRPDVEAFCRLQMGLFQYPNGSGAVYSRAFRIESKALADKKAEINSGLKLVPFRVILKALIELSKIEDRRPEDAHLSYEEIFYLFNNSSINTTSNPDISEAVQTIIESRSNKYSTPRKAPGTFKRNFHILEHTGLVQRTSIGLMLSLPENQELRERKLKAAEAIASMDSFFNEFHRGHADLKERIKVVCRSGSWGEYYDGLALPYSQVSSILQDRELEVSEDEVLPSKPIEAEIPSESSVLARRFPRPMPISAKKPIPPAAAREISAADAFAVLEAGRIKREKSNRRHKRILELLTRKLTELGAEPKDNRYVDIYTRLENLDFIFEVKSCNQKNMHSQVREGISQLIEYGYLAQDQIPNPQLCLVLQEMPNANNYWLVYFLKHLKIQVCWVEEEVHLGAPSYCRDALGPLVGIWH